MPILDEPNTEKYSGAGWWWADIHSAGVYIVDELFLSSRYVEMIRKKETDYENLKRSLSAVQANDELRRSLEFLKSEAGWALQQRMQGYHATYSHSLIGEWSVFEAGMERQFVRLLERDKVFALSALQAFDKPVRNMQISGWPWNREDLIYLCQRLAKKPQSRFFADRYIAQWGLIGVSITLSAEVKSALSEANVVRNALMHSYGDITDDDVMKAPELAEWSGKRLPINDARFNRYHQSIVETLNSTMRGIKAALGSRAS